MDDNTITVINDEGEEFEFEILFTFNSDETGSSYVLYYDPTQEEPAVHASIYDEEGNLLPVESAEEWDMIEEVYSAFMSEDEEEEA